MSLPQLPIHHLDHRHPGLLPSTAANYLDAARVCLDRRHTPPTAFTLTDNHQTSQTQIHWIPTTDRDRHAWANLDDATRDGAYALAAIEHLREFVAIRRAEGRTGADYYIMPIDGDPEDLETWYRLEISGTHLGTPEINHWLATDSLPPFAVRSLRELLLDIWQPQPGAMAIEDSISRNQIRDRRLSFGLVVELRAAKSPQTIG